MNPRWSDGEAPWADLKARFRLRPDCTFMDAMFMASHPDVVRDAIARHQEGLDADPVHYFRTHAGRLLERVAGLAGEYLGLDDPEVQGPHTVALTDSTTMGLGLLFNGLVLADDQHVLMPRDSPYFSVQSLINRAEMMDGTVATRAGGGGDGGRPTPTAHGDVVPGDRVKEFDVALDGARTSRGGVDEKAVVATVLAAIEKDTRALALTWVSSATGWKMPVAAICAAVRELNESREEGREVLTIVDGVHALGVEDFSVEDLGCDFFVAGCHKWLFGPRGTGFVYGRPEAWAWIAPIIPKFRPGGGPGRLHSPGGIHSYANRFALAEAFELHLVELGKDAVQDRTRALATLLKDGLAATTGVTLVTPRDVSDSSGIVCCDVTGLDPGAAVESLARNHQIRATRSLPDGFGDDAPTHLRLSPSVLNSEYEVERTVRAVAALAR